MTHHRATRPAALTLGIAGILAAATLAACGEQTVNEGIPPLESATATSTAASVGPNRFTIRTCGSSSWARATTAGGSASPEANSQRSVPRREIVSAGTTSRNTDSIDGTKCTEVAPLDAIRSAM